MQAGGAVQQGLGALMGFIFITVALIKFFFEYVNKPSLPAQDDLSGSMDLHSIESQL